MNDKCKYCLYYEDCLPDSITMKKCIDNNNFLFSTNCYKCKYFSYEQSAKYFGHPCDIYDGAFRKECADYKFVEVKIL